VKDEGVFSLKEYSGAEYDTLNPVKE